MTNFYSILQYVDDPVADERINVGVFAYSDAAVTFVPTDNWSKIRCVLGAAKLARVKAAVRDIASWKSEDIKAFHQSPYGVFNLTTPSASMLPTEQLAFFIAGRVLPSKDDVDSQSHRVRSEIVSTVRTRVRGELKGRFGARGRTLLWDRRRTINETSFPTKPDVAIGGAQPVQIIQALSFEESNEAKVSVDVQSTGFLIKAIRGTTGSLQNTPIAVVCTRPKETLKTYYAKVVEEFEADGAEIVVHDDVTGWTAQQIEKLPVGVFK